MAARLESVSIEQFVGRCKGVLKPEPLDWVIAHTNRGAVKVGLVTHVEGATLRFIRVLPDDLREEIRRRVAVLRKDQGGNRISDRTSSIPDPRVIKGFLRGEKFRKRKTVVSRPDGVPSAGEKKDERRIWTPGE